MVAPLFFGDVAPSMAMVEGELAARRELVAVGGFTPLAKFGENAPWWQYVTPKYRVGAWGETVGRTEEEIAATKAHEGQHIGDILDYPQITYLAIKRTCFPGAGLARY